MSIFDNVRTSKIDAGMNLMLALRYGEPNHSNEYFARLPEVVIRTAYKKLHSGYNPNTDQAMKIQVLRIYLRQPINKPRAVKAITDALIEYHTLI